MKNCFMDWSLSMQLQEEKKICSRFYLFIVAEQTGSQTLTLRTDSTKFQRFQAKTECDPNVADKLSHSVFKPLPIAKAFIITRTLSSLQKIYIGRVSAVCQHCYQPKSHPSHMILSTVSAYMSSMIQEQITEGSDVWVSIISLVRFLFKQEYWKTFCKNPSGVWG